MYKPDLIFLASEFTHFKFHRQGENINRAPEAG